MSEKKQKDKPIEGHEYDGIVELDNPLPSWWLYSFYMTIIFGALYSAYYLVGNGQSLVGAYLERVAVIDQAREATAGEGFDGAAILAMRSDPAGVKAAGALFAEKCAACHGDQAQGVIGPNLTDIYWLHGGEPDEIAATIQKGVGDKGMPAWGETLTRDEIQVVAAYILSLQGSKPAGAREPQGKAAKE